ncbi:MAG TPA: UDP-N-acetylmuramoyl-tripeptide--D-alanyl-D-alanine ligase [Acidobacteriaceae bacterium]|nr:UDP-N-acetylmuramoyl-tripeptide--D-alanyl-D-alanine ligase [Acidobacteriaceae bacterium]
MTFTLGQIADILHAEGDFPTAAEATGYSIDSRTLAAGDLFFAVRGERVDGHDFVPAALANGAVAAVVSQRWLAPSSVDATKLLRVPDEDTDCVLGALQKLAHATRRQWAAHGHKRVIGITGSAGKTTTKDCVAQVLGTRFRVLKTEGNLNNHFGLPLQLLRLQPEHDIAVLEMGMNHAGEIAALARIAEPDWAVVSNVAAVHTEFFADGIEGVARAKKELVDALRPDGLAFLNADDNRVAGFARGRGEQVIFYGTAESANVRAVEVEELGLAGTQFLVRAGRDGRFQQHSVQLRLLGRHNILNALAAISVGLACGIPLRTCCEALEALRSGEKRGSVVEIGGARLINDCYNSNPHALNAMVATLAATPAQRRILVAGEMLELGPQSAFLHAECGRAAAQAGIDLVLGVRGLAEHLVHAAAEGDATAQFFATPEEAAIWLRAELRPGDVVLFKASRGVRLERALEELSANAETTAGQELAGTSPSARS